MSSRHPNAATITQEVELVYQQFGISQNTRPLSDDSEAPSVAPESGEQRPARELIYVPGLSQHTRILAKMK